MESDSNVCDLSVPVHMLPFGSVLLLPPPLSVASAVYNVFVHAGSTYTCEITIAKKINDFCWDRHPRKFFNRGKKKRSDFYHHHKKQVIFPRLRQFFIQSPAYLVCSLALSCSFLSPILLIIIYPEFLYSASRYLPLRFYLLPAQCQRQAWKPALGSISHEEYRVKLAGIISR